jgi:hypothetical protein
MDKPLHMECAEDDLGLLASPRSRPNQSCEVWDGQPLSCRADNSRLQGRKGPGPAVGMGHPIAQTGAGASHENAKGPLAIKETSMAPPLAFIRAPCGAVCGLVC